MEWVIVLVIVIVLGSVFGKPRRCTVCGTPIKRTYYTWTIDGKKHKLCPNCNRNLERKVSREATRDL